MKRIKEDLEREERIIMEIVVDAHDEDEGAMGWNCYLDSTLHFPFKAVCTHRRQTSPLKPKQRVEVTGMADSEECMAEMLVLIEWDNDELAVPLEQLQSIGADEETTRAVEDWQYWVARGYGF